ncbi:hypothetical protein [Streptomyces sp. x-80]|uniref:hypothetical protein n=1 Tax=Streptomyces sp. x-80 TaxID=2789282 RepID=UPI0039804E2F
MIFPPPPSSPPNQPPNGNPGGFGPPAGGFGPGQGQGGYGPGGYGPPAGNQPPGGFGPPAGGYGPGGPGGPVGGWPPPGPPAGGGGGGNGKTIAAIIGGGVIAVAAVVVFVVMSNSGGDNGKNQAAPVETGTSATPSATGSATPTGPTTPPATPTASTDIESMMPSPTNGKIPFFQLKPGDCYNLPAGGGGNNDAASCNGAHDAEVVSTHRLDAGLTSEDAIKEKASALCKNDLQSKAVRQPAGTAEGTYVQFPNMSGYKIGIKTVSCSLTGNRTGTKKLTKPLS